MSTDLFLKLSAVTCMIFILQSILLYLMKYFAFYDRPDYRKIHTNPKLTGGGILFILSWLLLTGFSGVTENIYIFSAFLMVSILGFFDDIKIFSAKVKLIIHFITGFLMFYGNAGFSEFLGIENLFITAFITILYYVSFINIINLIDGADGLATLISSIILGGILFLSLNMSFSGEIIILLLSMLVFLIWNLKNSIIFMGDCGSNFLGFIIAYYILRTGFMNFSVSLSVPFILLIFLPFFDTLLAIFRRIKNKKSIFSPDKEHIHHILIRSYGLNKALIIMTFVQFLFTSISLYMLRGVLW